MALALWAFLAVLAVGGLFAALLRVREQVLQHRFEIVLDERTRIAREIHDTLLQGFTAVTLQAQVATDQVEVDPPAAKAALEDALEQADRTLVEARQSIWDKRSPSLDGQTLPEALEAAARRAAAGSGLAVRMTQEGAPEDLPDAAEADLLRIGTEAAVNAVRHAGGSEIAVRLAYAPEDLVLEVRDDGCGFDPAESEAARAGRWGLLGMRERAARLGATLQVESAPGAGTTVRLAFPRRQW